MNLTITARRFDLDDDLRDYIESKAPKLSRYYEGIIDLEILLGWEKQTRYAEIKITVQQKVIVVKEATEDLRKSFDQAMESAERQLKRYKEKTHNKNQDKRHSA